MAERKFKEKQDDFLNIGDYSIKAKTKSNNHFFQDDEFVFYKCKISNKHINHNTTNFYQYFIIISLSDALNGIHD